MIMWLSNDLARLEKNRVNQAISEENILTEEAVIRDTRKADRRRSRHSRNMCGRGAIPPSAVIVSCRSFLNALVGGIFVKPRSASSLSTADNDPVEDVDRLVEGMSTAGRHLGEPFEVAKQRKERPKGSLGQVMPRTPSNNTLTAEHECADRCRAKIEKPEMKSAGNAATNKSALPAPMVRRGKIGFLPAHLRKLQAT